MAVEVFANLPVTTVISGGISAPASGATETWTVTSSVTFPVASSSTTPATQFHVSDITQNTEIMAVTNISGNTWTVTRGAEGTIPVEHLSGFTIYQVVSAGAFTQLQTTDWLNVVTMFGADPTGTNDSTTAIQNALNASAGQSVYLPYGTFLLNSASGLTMTASGQAILGDGAGATVLIIGSAFTGTSAISAAGYNDIMIRDLEIKGHSATYSANPSAHGIVISHCQRPVIQRVRGYALNGYLVQVISDATGDSYYPVLDTVHSIDCASGCLLQATNSSDNLMGAFLSNCTFEECQDGDALYVADVIDLTCVNLEASVQSSTGSTVHIHGGASQFYSNVDLGGPASGGGACPNPTVLIETGAANPFGIVFGGGVIEYGTPGVNITAGSEITFNSTQITQNDSYGLETGGSCTLINLFGCTFDLNNLAGGAGGYDIYHDSTGKIMVQGCQFNTPLGTGVKQVAAAASIQGSTGTSDFFGNRFNAATAFVTAGGFPTLARSNPGYNPVGYISSPPAVPASGTPQTNSEGADMTIIVTAASGGTCGISINTHSVATIAASGVLAVPLAATLSITLTYGAGNAPTWFWYGS